MCEITILKFSNLSEKVYDSDIAHFLEDATKVKKHLEIRPPLNVIESEK